MARELAGRKFIFKKTKQKVSLMFVFLGFTKDDLEALPFGVSIPLREAIHRCCIEPSFHLPPASYALIGEFYSDHISFLAIFGRL